ncbi:BZ3500_MvSof-1268-A1-R1_Chr3-3g06589 [Microbotryum saponariae]|uniref:ATP-dependent DNA helicase n=1 Tax=Microbotryum saponariae TaxID=289078 RepID=A0A2X0L1C5_9BASI|nr:BZ3500_MvSof-1268-A1-R1_Chr3-3g06589 [Microbotryum saponariae]SDA04556.1 BZ3501_MvSof-1269-A2-R1_Chr3-2g06276 [Microbotryum saponariae]
MGLLERQLLGVPLLDPPLPPAPINRISPPRVLTTTQPILVLRPVYEAAVQLIALKPLKPRVSIRDDLGPQTAVCTHCKARHWECERSKSTGHFSTCCSQGKVRLPPPPQPNLEYRQLLEGSESEAKAFRENARSYNNALSFTSLAAHWDQTPVGTLGPPVFRVFGRLYHRLGALIPAVNQRPAFAQTWLIDPAEATDTRLGPDSADNRVQRSTLTKLESMLRTGNRFVREFASAKARAGWDTAKEWILRLYLPPGRDRRTHNLPTSSTEMPMLICDSDTNTGDRGPQDLILQVHGDRCLDGRPKYQIVSSLHPSAMPLRYPLLFPAGEDEQIDNGVQLRELLAGLGPYEEDEEEGEDRDDEDEDDEVDEENGDDERRRSSKRGRGGSTRASRSQFFAYYLHERDDYFSSRPIDSNYIRLHQESLRLTTAQGITDAVANGLAPDQIGRSVILGSTFKNSPREITQRYQDAMACVVKYGKPLLFITVTCNPEWPEIKAALGPNDKACNRPDLIARVFEAKLNRLCDDVFGNKQRAGCVSVVLTHTHVIEYQKRSLPHAHVLLTLAPDDHPSSTEAIDKMISAEIPDSSRYPDLHETVTKHMLHGKCGGNSTQPCMEKDKYGNPRCKRRFPRKQNPHTRMHPDGYPLYRRRFRHAVVKGGVIYNDGDCVPYSPYLSAKYNAHINVEAVTTIGATKYLFKYVYKGPDRAVARVEHAANGEGARKEEPVRDEINEFVEGRYISAPEAVHRLFGFSVGRVWPPVNRLPVHLENQQSVQINPNEALPLDTPPTRSKLTGFFDLCAAAPDGELTTTLLYTNVPRYYSWDKEKLPGSAELLLEVVMGPTSFADLLMFEDVVYPSYRAACAARGLLADDGEHHSCLREAAQIETGDQLRRLFVFILIHATVANPPALLDRHFASLSDDARYHIERYEDVPVNDETIRLWTLNKIRLLLAANDRTLAFFDLPELTDDEVRPFDRLEERLPRFDRQQRAQDGEAARARLNHDQRIAFDEFLRAVELDVVDQMRDNNLGPQHVFFLLAPGGTGNTFVKNALLDTVRARGDQAIAVASSGVAALLLKGGHTAHSTFRIPLDTLPTSTCPVDRESDLALMLRSTKLIIWDEAPKAHRFAMEAVDRLLRDLRETEELFGGVTTIFAGDFRQCLPVVPKGTPGQIVDASLIKADFWRDVRILRLTENMRLSSNADAMDEAQLARTREFAEWLLTVGDGTANMHPYDKIALPDYLLLPDGQRTAEGLINFVYPGLRTVNKESIEDLIQLFSRQAILAPHNATVDRINAKLLGEFDGDYIEYRSADEVVEAGEAGGGHDTLIQNFCVLTAPPVSLPHPRILTCVDMCKDTRARARAMRKDTLARKEHWLLLVNN